MPDAMEIIFQKAIAFGTNGAVSILYNGIFNQILVFWAVGLVFDCVSGGRVREQKYCSREILKSSAASFLYHRRSNDIVSKPSVFVNS